MKMDGVMEYWSNGLIGEPSNARLLALPHSITPLLHHSIPG